MQYTQGRQPLLSYFSYHDTYVLVVRGLACLHEQVLKRHVFREDWIVWSNYDNHSRINTQQICEKREIYVTT